MRQQRTVRARARRGPPHWVLAVVALAVLPGVARAQTTLAAAPAVAVLEFRVHSAEPQSALADALAEAVRERLARDERVGAVDAQGRGAPTPRVGETRDAALRRFAREIGADYLVTGSLTQLAGRFSLDLRLTAAAVALESDTQIITAQSEEELLERLDAVADRIIAQVVGAAPAKVARVEVRGALGFDDQLLARLETRAGQPYDPLTVRADLSTLRSAAVVVSAEAQTERTDEGIVVVFDVVLADPSLALAEGGDQVIAEIVIRGNRRIEAGAIRARIGSKVGEGFDPGQVPKDIGEIHSLGFFRNVRVLADRTDAGLVLIYEVEENPIVRQISISGNENIEGDKIRDALTLTTGSTLDYPLLFENRQRVEALYRAEGYYLGSVAFEIEPLGEAAVGIHFNIDEKDKLKLLEIVFEGNEHFSDSELTEGFQTRTWRFWSYATSWLDNSGTYSEPLFFQDLRRAERKYTDAGFLQARVGKPEVRIDEEGLVVVVGIEEGELFRVGQLDVTGDSTVDIESLRDKLKLKEGEVFNRSFLNDDIAALTEHYQDRGFYFAQVTFVSNLSEASEAVDVDFEVRKGPLYFIRRIDIAGNGITRDPVIRREIPIAEGQLYSQHSVLLARSKVERLGFFEEVDFQMQPTEEPDQLDLKVSVVERPTGSLSFGAGFSSQDGLAVNGSLSQSNLFGRGYGANISLDLGRETQRFFINLSDPYFLGSTFSLSASARGQTFEFEDFEQERSRRRASCESVTRLPRTAGLAASPATASTCKQPRGRPERQRRRGDLPRDPPGPDLDAVWSVSRSISDTRDDRLAPTSGHRLGVNRWRPPASAASRSSSASRRVAPGSSELRAGSSSARASCSPPGSAGRSLSMTSATSRRRTSSKADRRVSRTASAFPLDQIDDDLTLPLTDRYILGGLGQFSAARLQGTNRGTPPTDPPAGREHDGLFAPLGFDALTGECNDTLDGFNQGNLNGICNDIDCPRYRRLRRSRRDRRDRRQQVRHHDVSSTASRSRRPWGSRAWPSSTWATPSTSGPTTCSTSPSGATVPGFGVQWFSPFGPLAVVLGFPLDKLVLRKIPRFRVLHRRFRAQPSDPPSGE